MVIACTPNKAGTSIDFEFSSGVVGQGPGTLKTDALTTLPALMLAPMIEVRIHPSTTDLLSSSSKAPWLGLSSSLGRISSKRRDKYTLFAARTRVTVSVRSCDRQRDDLRYSSFCVIARTSGFLPRSETQRSTPHWRCRVDPAWICNPQVHDSAVACVHLVIVG